MFYPILNRRWRPEDVLDPWRTEREHHEAVETERHAACLRHESERLQKVLIERIAGAVTPLHFVHLAFKARALLTGIGQFAEAVGELDAADIELEALGEPSVVRHGARQRQI